MANIVKHRRAWMAEPKRVKSKNFITDDQRAAGITDYYVSPEWRRLRRSFFGEFWDNVAKKYIKTKNLLCVNCEDMGFAVPATVADHIIPRNMGGADALDNLQALCNACHDRKSAKEKNKYK